MCGSAGGTEGAAPAGGGTATGASRGRPLGGAVDGPGRRHLGPARPQPADPASAPHPFLADSRPRPRDGAENHGVSRPARPRLRRGGCSRPLSRRLLRPARGPVTAGDGQLRPTASRRALSRRRPPALPRRRRRGAGAAGGPRSRKHTHFHIAALVLKALDAVVLQARVLGHGCARLRRRLLLRRRVSAREGEVGERGRERAGEGEESTFRDASEREVAAAPGPAQADCRVGRSGAGPAWGNERAWGDCRHVPGAAPGPGGSPGQMCLVLWDDPNTPLPQGLVLPVRALQWNQWLSVLPGEAEMHIGTTVPSIPRPGVG